MASSSLSAREYFSAALAPLQIDFVSGVPTKVRTLIRLVKYWRKTEFEVYNHLYLITRVEAIL